MRISIFALLILLILNSCERRPLEDTIEARIPIKIFWGAKAQLDIPTEGATVILYNAHSEEIYRRYDASGNGTYMLNDIRVNRADSSFYCEIDAEIGAYKVVIFNQTLQRNGVPDAWKSGIVNNNNEALYFRNIENINTIEAFASEYIDKNTGRAAKGINDEPLINQPGVLASWRSEEILRVDMSMVRRSVLDGMRDKSELTPAEEELLSVQPERNTYTILLKLAVLNLGHAHPSSFSKSQISGMSKKFLVGLGQPSNSDAGTHQFKLNNAQYTNTPGVADTISAVFTTFGVLREKTASKTFGKPPIVGEYEFNTNIKKYDSEGGTPWTPAAGSSGINKLPYPVTDITKEKFENLEMNLLLGLALKLNLNLRIELPNDFYPWGKQPTGGFDGTVNDWMDEAVTIKFK